MSSSTPVILIDASDPLAPHLWSWGHQAQLALIHTPADILPALERAQGARASLVAVQGSLSFFSLVLSVHQRALSGSPHPLRFYLFSTKSSPLDAYLGLSESPKKRARHLLKLSAQSSPRTRRTPTLKLISSASPGARLAFDLGLGALFDLHESTQRGQLAGALHIGQLLAHIATARHGEGAPLPPTSRQRLILDRAPLPTPPAFLAASSLPASWFGLSMSREGGARVLLGDDVGALAGLLARSRAPLASLRAPAQTFDQIIVDYLEQYVCDGELVTPQRPFVLKVTPGPDVMLAH